MPGKAQRPAEKPLRKRVTGGKDRSLPECLNRFVVAAQTGQPLTQAPVQDGVARIQFDASVSLGNRFIESPGYVEYKREYVAGVD